MDPIEFHCRNCDTRLRVRLEDKDKLIRCPNCSDLQRYVGNEEFRPLESSPAADSRSQQPSASQPMQGDWWSLKTADGQEYHQLDRGTFEQLVRQGHANTAAYFIGGEYRQWTPIQRLFQSATGPQHTYEVPTGSPGGMLSGGAATTGWNPRSAQPASSQPRTIPTREQQLKDGLGNYVFILGIVSIFTFCFPVIAIVGFTLGVIDIVRLSNGTISNRYQTRLVIGLLLSLFALAVGTCYGCNVRFD